MVWTPSSALVDNFSQQNPYSLSINTQGDAILGYHCVLDRQIAFWHYDFVNDEGSPVAISPIKVEGEVTDFSILKSDPGTLFVMWKDNKAQQLQLSCFAQGEWIDPLIISDAYLIRNPSLDCDSSGNVWVVWEECNSYDFQIKAVTYTAQKKQWSEIVTLSSPGYNCHSKRVGLDHKGDVVIVFCAQSRMSPHHTDGVEALKIKHDFSQVVSFFSLHDHRFAYQQPHVEFDRNNTVYLVWRREDTFSDSRTIQSCSIASNLSERGPIRDLSSKKCTSPSLVSLNDKMYAFWITSNSSQQWLQSCDLNNLSPNIENIASPLEVIEGYHIRSDQYGQLKIIYHNDHAIHASLFDGEWIDTCLYRDKEKHSVVKDMQIQSDLYGNVLLTWRLDDTIFYSQGDHLLPPRRFSAKKTIKRFPTKKIIRALLTWEEAKNPSILRYKIRRNHVVLNLVSSTEFLDQYCPSGDIIYSICSVNDKGFESASQEIFFDH